jgi:hypothetical protein
MPASNFLKTAILQHFFRNQDQTGASAWYVALFTDDPGLDGDSDEVNVSGYGRESVTFITPLSGVSYNSADLDFGTPSESWGTITHWGLFDASSGGNCLLVQELDDPITPVVDEPLKVPAGKLKLEIG